MDLPALADFNLVATHGGFGRASRNCGRPKATLSRKVSELEAALGVRLIERGSHTLRLTDEGRALHELTRGPLGEIADAGQAVAAGASVPRGRLRVSAPIVLAHVLLPRIAVSWFVLDRTPAPVIASLLFVLGFSFVFVSFGALFGAVGNWLFTYQREITVVLGSYTIVLGLVFVGVVPWMQRDWRIHKVPAVGLAAAPLLGVLFGLGWAPCIGPTLQAVTTLALKESSAGRGALLSFFYCLGLGLPFIFAALAYRRMLGTVGWVRRHQQWVTAFGGLMLVAVGLLLVTGWWDVMVDWIRTWFFPDFTAGV